MCSLKTSVRASRVAVSRSRLPSVADRRTRERSSSAVRAEESSSFGSMPTERRITLAVLLSSVTKGRNTAVKPTWNGITSFAVGSGSASAKFFGTSSPTIIESRVARMMASTDAMTAVTGVESPSAPSGPVSRAPIAGSIVEPVRSVVSVMPSWALERWVDVILSAPIVSPRRFSPRATRDSRSDRLRLTRENSEATKNPVPTVSRRPTPSMISSYTRITAGGERGRAP
jgi:hypothetical protein